MRRTLLAVMLALTPAIAMAQTTPAPSPTAPAAAPAPTTSTAAVTRDVVILICGQDFTTGGGALLVFSASASQGAPAVAPGAGCAQALSDLFGVGFSVIDVQPFNQQLQYTLVR